MTSKSNFSNESVMIIGGGVAGMAAAETLSKNGTKVHLIEKNSSLGGHVTSWACMATETCQHCSACLSHEMAETIPKNTSVYLNSKIITINKNKHKYTAQLNNNKSIIEADRIILATGFQPTEPENLLYDQHKNNKNIITIIELNKILKDNNFPESFPKTNSPKIGFIQCVGSRNREKKRDYCSQVCCKISLRQINKLIHIFPDAQISLFYIDLQMIGKEARQQFDSLSKNVNLIQSVPQEIFNDKMDGKLSIIREDKKNNSRIADHFDLMVLSIGIRSSSSTVKLSDMLNIPVDRWGFVNNHDHLAKNNIFVAGCASGPCDILTAKHQGINCAEKVIQSFKPKQKLEHRNSIAIIGGGSDASKMAAAASIKGYDTWMFGLNNEKMIQAPNINYVPDAQLISINGTAGSFKILYNDTKTTEHKEFTAIIVAESAKLSPVEGEIDLPKDILYSLGDFLNRVQKRLKDIPQNLVFWLDYSNPVFKAFSRKALLIALDLADTGRNISFIINQMLVHGLKGQHLYDRARKKGIKFLRVNSSKDVTIKKMNERILFDIKEKTLNNLILSFECDWLIIPEKIAPSDKNPFIANLLKIQMDKEGYLQSANVRHRMTNCLRKGIFFTGTCHDETDEEDQTFETQLILTAIDSLANKAANDSDTSIEINKNKCRQCLTCFRTCPHGAIILNHNTKPHIDTNACFSCGLCISSCPALAIESIDFSDSSYINSISKDELVIFACERSSAIAADQIELDPMINIQKVPCVCRVSDNLLLKALENGAKKILLAGCHHDNCNSIKGSKKAQVQTKLLNELPGIDNETFIFHPFAANESAKLQKFLALEFLQKENNKGQNNGTN